MVDDEQSSKASRAVEVLKKLFSETEHTLVPIMIHRRWAITVAVVAMIALLAFIDLNLGINITLSIGE